LAKLVPRDVEQGKTSTFLWQRPKICFDEDLDGFLGRINFDPYGRFPKIYLVSAIILSADDGMRHFCVSPPYQVYPLPKLHKLTAIFFESGRLRA
jgi:hypothetical protein